MDAVDEEFIDLEYLITSEGVEVSLLADAIEKEGIWGLDRYGRFKRFTPGEEGAQRALDALAAQHSTSRYPGEQPAVETAEWEWTFRSYGWLKKDLPHFSQVGQIPSKLASQPRGPALRAANVNLRIIAALLDIIINRMRADQPKPEYAGSEAKLIKFLENMYQGYEGFGKRTLEIRFADAKKALQD